ncbi:metallophosphoesterase family protein [Ureibacillus chungkukjangi]|uniref:metallophosphoesterase family protein n=1 Tax=Ureibacillus chungkukjangi TaxID=1202712 RepID=UPI00203B77DA|nr:metallophosphoesterase family protein [Ureibacillus chungkukjangi]MCM3387267.1 metallophosphoesterase family protein [Ureibacillus chungkukjangi]
MTIYITSDTHFHHSNVLEFEDRPYESLEEMNKGLIDAWNSVVNKTDTVYMLGDFCFGKLENWIDTLNQLRGKIILIKGNHDKDKIIKRVLNEGYIEELHNVGLMLKVDGFTLNLTHYPMEIGNRPRNFSIHGHLHSNPSRMLNQVNVGVDSDLAKKLNKPFGTPITLDELVVHLHEINPLVEEEFLKERGK